MVLGKFNAQLGKEKRHRDIIGKWPVQRKTKKNGTRLLELCRNSKLITKSTYFMRKPNKLKTWKQPDWRKDEYQLDHVCMERDQQKEIQNIKVLRGTDTGSYHYLFKIKLTPKRKEKEMIKSKLKRKYNAS